MLAGSAAFTGPVTINGGILGVTNFANSGFNSSLGSTGASSSLVLNGGILDFQGAAPRPPIACLPSPPTAAEFGPTARRHMGISLHQYRPHHVDQRRWRHGHRDLYLGRLRVFGHHQRFLPPVDRHRRQHGTHRDSPGPGHGRLGHLGPDNNHNNFSGGVTLTPNAILITAPGALGSGRNVHPGRRCLRFVATGFTQNFLTTNVESASQGTLAVAGRAMRRPSISPPRVSPRWPSDRRATLPSPVRSSRTSTAPTACITWAAAAAV